MYTFTCVSPGLHTFSAQDGDLTATLTRTYVAEYRFDGVIGSAWDWEVRVCDEVVDAGHFHNGGIRLAREAASLVLDVLSPHFVR